MFFLPFVEFKHHILATMCINFKSLFFDCSFSSKGKTLQNALDSFHHKFTSLKFNLFKCVCHRSLAQAKNMENLVLLTLGKICSMMDSEGSDFQATNIDCKTSIAKTISAFGCAMNLYSLWFIYTQPSFAHCCIVYIVRENESLDVYCQNLLNFHADAKQKCCDSVKLKEIYWAINILTFFKFYKFWWLLSNESIPNALKFSEKFLRFITLLKAYWFF